MTDINPIPMGASNMQEIEVSKPNPDANTQTNIYNQADLGSELEKLRAENEAMKNQLQSKNEENEMLDKTAMEFAEQGKNNESQVNKYKDLLAKTQKTLKQREEELNATRGEAGKYKKDIENNPITEKYKNQIQEVASERDDFKTRYERLQAEHELKILEDRKAKHIERLYQEHMAGKVDDGFKDIIKDAMMNHVDYEAVEGDEGRYFARNTDGAKVQDKYGRLVATDDFFKNDFLNIAKYKSFARKQSNNHLRDMNQYDNNAKQQPLPVDESSPQKDAKGRQIIYLSKAEFYDHLRSGQSTLQKDYRANKITVRLKENPRQDPFDNQI